ncbi:MAG: hypothetical protein JWN03_6158 [Nocardia sp.]|uniref:DUF397 domain-containing protein n=1 Tax=Nocardia sp. TaxID=1821 RepID=UPI00261725C0|nr:DUF397 domain-containing protein [Nocardia sp.]MCU1645883.1 hypothetical protein [Nocardia sp.]
MKKPVRGIWYKSSKSDGAKQCVEIFHDVDRVGVRDSKQPGGPELFFTGEQWDRFLAGGVWGRE